MSQGTNVIADQAGATFLTALNAALAALVSGHSGTSDPAYAVAGQGWWRTDVPGSGTWTFYIYDGANKVAQFKLDTSAHTLTYVGIVSDTVTADRFIASSSNVNVQTGTSYTLQASDNGKVVTMSNASSSTLTVPSGLAAGFACTVVQLGAGQVTIVQGSGTTLRARNGLKCAGQYAQAAIFYLASETYSVGGDLTT